MTTVLKVASLDIAEGRHNIFEILKNDLTLFFPMFAFDIPENIRKHLVLWCFQVYQKGTSNVCRVFLVRPAHTLNPWRCQHDWRRWAVNFSKFVLPDALKIHSLALFVLRFLCKTFPKLFKSTLRDTLLRGWFSYIKKIKNCMVINLWELQSNLGWEDAASGTEGITQSSTNIYVI